MGRIGEIAVTDGHLAPSRGRGWSLHAVALVVAIALVAACGQSEPSPDATTGEVTTAGLPTATSVGPFMSAVSFENTQTGAGGACDGVPQARTITPITGEGTWTATRRGQHSFEVVAQYESGARLAGELSTASHDARLNSMESTAGALTMRSTSALHLNDDLTKASGTGQLVVTQSNGGICTVGYSLSVRFADPLLPEDAR